MKITDKFLKCVWIVVIVLSLLLVTVLGTDTNNSSKQESLQDYVRILDVGQGDSILIMSEGYTALIDTSTAEYGQKILKKLRHYGASKIDVMILTHPHEDHIGSANYIMSEIDVGSVIISPTNPEKDSNVLAFDGFKQYSEKYSVPYYYASQGMAINIGNFELTVLLSLQSSEDENDNSIVIMAKNDDKKFLLMGDAEAIAENTLIEQNIYFDCDVLKVGHHGSNSSSTKDFLSIATPEYAVISAGYDNSFGHPHADVLYRLDDIGADIYRTDMQKDISFLVKNNQLVLEVG